MSNQRWRDDPRGLLFILARYKFVAKMLAGKDRVVEIGCADAFGTRVVQQEVGAVTASDFDPVFIDDARSRMASRGLGVRDSGPRHPRRARFRRAASTPRTRSTSSSTSCPNARTSSSGTSRGRLRRRASRSSARRRSSRRPMRPREARPGT